MSSTTDSLSVSAEPNKPNLGFVACIEGSLLKSQALLLFESIRIMLDAFATALSMRSHPAQDMLSPKAPDASSTTWGHLY